MKFNLIDKIEQLDAQRIVAVKYVSLAEEYLADHFPTFPVLPGVMMLEALTQAAGWLMHRRTNFSRSMAVLKEARNVKYGTFVAPGGALDREAHARAVTVYAPDEKTPLHPPVLSEDAASLLAQKRDFVGSSFALMA